MQVKKSYLKQSSEGWSTTPAKGGQFKSAKGGQLYRFFQI